MRSIFKLYIFKLAILSLAMIFISFGASAKDTLYSCVNDEWQFKVEDTIFGKRKLFYRRDGVWERTCSLERDIVNDTSFKCIGASFIGYKYYILDEEFKTITFKQRNDKIEVYKCNIVN